MQSFTIGQKYSCELERMVTVSSEIILVQVQQHLCYKCADRKLIQAWTQYNIVSWIIFTPNSQILPRIILIQEDRLICLAYYEISLACIINLTENITHC